MLEKAYVFKNAVSSWGNMMSTMIIPLIIMCRQHIDSSQTNGDRMGIWLRIFLSKSISVLQSLNLCFAD